MNFILSEVLSQADKIVRNLRRKIAWFVVLFFNQNWHLFCMYSMNFLIVQYYYNIPSKSLDVLKTS